MSDHYAETILKEDSRSVDIVNDDYIKMNLSGSLMTSLERLPGVSTITIGAGQSKPVIRGLGFNRVVVTENGIKHESQQWGADHGLEMDQYAAERIEVIKGPASLQFGSDAIGGLVNISQIETPPANSVGGTIDLSIKGNNNSIGTSAGLYVRKNKYFVTTRVSAIDYGDYMVPTDTVYLYTWAVPLHNNRVRNTAGKEYNWHFSSGYIGNKFSSWIYFSSINMKSGFFANAAGLEPLNADFNSHDKSNRDILMPYQNVSHTKISNRSLIRFGKNKAELNLGYQRNFRQEWMTYSQHGNMPALFPADLPFPSILEKEFKKDNLSGSIKTKIQLTDKIDCSFGINGEITENKINGRGFLIPEYTQFNTGAFVYSKIKLTSRLILNSGLRYDFGHIRTSKYFDWYEPFNQRSWAINRNFHSSTWSVGLSFNPAHYTLKANLGKSFRIPIAKELAANGLNSHMFRVERGDSSLSSEYAYQFDIGAEFYNDKFAFGISPFISIFPNYIYLNPTSEFDSQTNKQVYQYTQSKVFRYGGELHAHYNVLSSLRFGIMSEMVFSKQLTGLKKGFTLPYSPPAGVLFNIKYTLKDFKHLHIPYISVDYKIVMEQNEIVPPEIPTPGYQLVNIGAGVKIFTKGRHINTNLQIRNLFNTKYFNHTSYYRIIDLPEKGINVILNIHIPFNKEFKN